MAIAPLIFERARMYGMPVRRLRLLQNDHSPRADFIVADHAEEAYRAIWTALFHERNNWDVLLLSQLPAEDRDRALDHEPGRGGRMRDRPVAQRILALPAMTGTEAGTSPASRRNSGRTSETA